MTPQKRLITTTVLAGAIGAAFVVGQVVTSASPAEASATRAYTLRIGDRVAIPAISQVCTVSKEGGAVDLFCARPRNARHQVSIFRDSILVWKVGNPDRPVGLASPENSGDIYQHWPSAPSSLFEP